MLRSIIDYLERPEIFEESEVNFWNDEYISKNLLQAHLDPNFEGASRKLNLLKNLFYG